MPAFLAAKYHFGIPTPTKPLLPLRFASLHPSSLLYPTSSAWSSLTSPRTIANCSHGTPRLSKKSAKSLRPIFPSIVQTHGIRTIMLVGSDREAISSCWTIIFTDVSPMRTSVRPGLIMQTTSDLVSEVGLPSNAKPPKDLSS